MSWRQARRERREAAVGNRQLLYNPRYGAGAATNPDPEVFSWAERKLLQRWKQPINWAVKTMSVGRS